MSKKSDKDIQTKVMNLFIQGTGDRLIRIRNKCRLCPEHIMREIVEIENGYIEEFFEKLRRIV